MEVNIKSAKIEKTYNWVIVLDEQGIRRLYDEIINQLNGENRNENPTIKITLGYSDGSSVITDNLEDLLKEENIRKNGY